MLGQPQNPNETAIASREVYEKDVEDEIVDTTGDVSVALNFYDAALMAVPFLPDSPVQTPAPTPAPTPEGLVWMLGAPTPLPATVPTPAPTQEELDLVSRMAWMVDGSDSEQGGASDAESYGKAPYRV